MLNLLPDFHGTLVIRLEEVIGAVVLDCFPAVLSNIEDYNRQKEEATSMKQRPGGRDVSCCVRQNTSRNLQVFLY